MRRFWEETLHMTRPSSSWRKPSGRCRKLGFAGAFAYNFTDSDANAHCSAKLISGCTTCGTRRKKFCGMGMAVSETG